MEINCHIELLVFFGVAFIGSQLTTGCPQDLPLTENIVRFNDKCYQFVQEEKKWTPAREFCMENGGKLVKVDTEAISQFLVNTLNGMTQWSNNAVWIGLHDKVYEQTFQWVGAGPGAPDEPLGWSRWAPNQPGGSLLSGSEDCVRIVRNEDWMWKETQCSSMWYKYRFICEYVQVVVSQGDADDAVPAENAETTVAADPAAEPAATVGADVAAAPEPTQGADQAGDANAEPEPTAEAPAADGATAEAGDAAVTEAVTNAPADAVDATPDAGAGGDPVTDAGNVDPGAAATQAPTDGGQPQQDDTVAPAGDGGITQGEAVASDAPQTQAPQDTTQDQTVPAAATDKPAVAADPSTPGAEATQAPAVPQEDTTPAAEGVATTAEVLKPVAGIVAETTETPVEDPTTALFEDVATQKPMQDVTTEKVEGIKDQPQASKTTQQPAEEVTTEKNQDVTDAPAASEITQPAERASTETADDVKRKTGPESVTGITVEIIGGVKTTPESLETTAPSMGVHTKAAKPLVVVTRKVSQSQTTSQTESPVDVLSTALPAGQSDSQQNLTPEGATTTEDYQTTVVIPDDPCEPGGSQIVMDDRRYYSYKGEDGSYICDDDLVSRWYAFKYQGQWAEITTTCIKSEQCGTEAPYYVRLEDGQAMPRIGEELNATLCEFARIVRHDNILPACCVYSQAVWIRNCTDHFVYYLNPMPSKRCATGACIQLPGEIIPYEYLGDPPPTAAPTTEEPTTKAPLNVPIMSLADMSVSQKAGVVTVVYSWPQDTLGNDFEEWFDLMFRRKVAELLNNLPPPPTEAATTVQETTAAETTTTAKTTPAGLEEVVTRDVDDIQSVGKPDSEKDNEGPDVPDLDNEDAGKGPDRKRRAPQGQGGDAKYNESDIYYVAGTPRPKDGTVEMAIFVKKGDDDAVPVERLMEALQSLNDSADSDMGNETLITFYEGLPKDLDPEASPSNAGQSVWDLHRDLFIAIIVLAIICLLIILIGFCCIKYKDHQEKKGDKTPVTMEEGIKKGKKVPLVAENPVPDEEITRDEAPMIERENPAVTPNGAGQHISKKDEDNGWVVPMDELSRAEKDRPEVENTKL